jgi:hypothetical protein
MRSRAAEFIDYSIACAESDSSCRFWQRRHDRFFRKSTVSTSSKLLYSAWMNPESKRKAVPLIRAVALVQIKLLLGAARDLVLSPLTLVAGLLDLVRLKSHEPRFFRQVLRTGEKTDEWIDLWSGGREGESPPRENVDALLARVEEVVRDPQTGARRARVLKRWAERQAARARQHVSRQLADRRTDKDR